MSGWLTTARNSLRREAAAPVAMPFERVCLCGEVLTGEREGSSQTVFCNRCGRDWFVLSGDAYPVPKSRKRKKKASKGRSSGKGARGAPVNGSAPIVQGAREAKGDGASGPSTREETINAVPVGPPWHERLRVRLRRGARPIRLVAMGILVLFVLTGVWLWHQGRLDQAREVLVDAEPAAEAAIAKGDLLTAVERMGEAADAVDILGRDDAGARRILQRHRELVAITELSSLTPYNLAAEAELSASDPGQWSRRFAASYAGRWVILDVSLGKMRAATSNTPKRSEMFVEDTGVTEDLTKENSASNRPVENVIPLELPLVAGDTPVLLELEAEHFRGLAESSRAILALQYRSWRMMEDATGTPVWVVRFNPETAFPWTSADLYEAAGFAVDDPILPAREQLEKQADMLSDIGR